MDHCATPDQLVNFLHDQLEGPQRETFAAHVEDCLTCQQALDQLTRSPVAMGVRTTERNRNGGDSVIVALLKAKVPLFFEEELTDFRPSEADEMDRQAEGSATERNEADRSARLPSPWPSITGFKIIREIGRGGMGMVYEAEEERLSRLVALKVLPVGALHNPKQIERFRREAKAAARLHHTNIVPVFGVGDQAGHPYYVMQFIDGRGLDDVLRELRLLRQDESCPRPSATLEPPDVRAPPIAGEGYDVQGPLSPTPAEIARSLASGQFERPASPTADWQMTEAAESATVVLAPPIVIANHPPGGESNLVRNGSSKFLSQSNFSRPYFQSVARIGLQVAEALDYANRQGVLHRDIKPSNLLLDTKGSVLVTDFGLAKTADSDDLTDTGDVVGTLRYMAPERFRGQCDIRSDIYSLGLTLYELVALRPAFEASDRHELIEKVLHQEPDSLGKLAEKIPRDFETICLKCLQKEPAKRYASAQALADDLRGFLDGRPIAARPVSLWERSWRWCRRNPKLAAVSGVLAATILFAASAFMGLTYRHNLRLRDEIGRTQASAAEARRNYQGAGSTIQSMLSLVENPRLEVVPRLAELRRDQREAALAFYERILSSIEAKANHSDDAVVMMDTIRELGLAAALERKLGHRDRADTRLEKALGLIENLHKRRPGDVEFLGLEIDILMKRGNVLAESGAPDRASAASRKAIELAEKLKQLAPDNLVMQEQYAMCYHAYANSMLGLRRFGEALTCYQQCTATRERIDPCKLPGVKQRLAESVTHEGLTHWQLGQNKEAEERFRRAEEILLSLPPEQRDPGGNFDVAVGVLNASWGGMLHLSRRYEEAIERANAGLSRIEPYLKTDPDDAPARDVCLKLHGNRANSLVVLGKHRESAADWTRVVELSTQPVPSGYRIALAIELLSDSQLDQALRQARYVQPAPDISDVNCYNLGCLFSLGADAARTDPSVSPDQRAKLIESHISDSLRWLKTAFEAGFFRDQANRDHARKDKDLEILRDRPEFRQLLEAPEDKSTKKGR